MHPSTEPTQAPPDHPRTARSSAPTLRQPGAPGRFGNALSQALAPSGPVAAGPSAGIGPTEIIKDKAPAKAAPRSAADAAVAMPDSTAGLAKPTIAGPTPSTPGAKPAKLALAAGKASEVGQPVPHIQAPPAHLVPAALPQVPATPGPAAVMPSAEAEALTPVASEAAGSTVGGVAPPELPSATVSATSQAAVQPSPSASAPPPHPAALSGIAEMAIEAAPDHLFAVMAGSEPLAAAPDAGPLPSIIPTPDMNAAPGLATAALHAVPTPSQATSRPSSAGEPPASAAGQVAPALASFALSAAHAGGPQNLVIRLDPTELGRVQVRIEHSPDGAARVDLRVERPDTLLMLLRDQPQLHRALDLAGVPSTDRTLQFHLAPSDAAAPGTTPMPSNTDPGSGQHRPGQPRSNGPTSTGNVFSVVEPTCGPAASRRAGVDITA